MPIDQELVRSLRVEFPELDKLALERIFGSGTVFFDRQNRARYPERQIYAALLVANSWALDAGFGTLRFIEREKRILRKHFSKVLIAIAFIGLCLFFNYFGDQDHDGVPDLFERFWPVASSSVSKNSSRILFHRAGWSQP